MIQESVEVAVDIFDDLLQVPLPSPINIQHA